jgi:hypothetical protein
MKYKNQRKDTRLDKTIKGLMAPLMTAMIFLCVSGGKAETLPTEEAKTKLIEQCIRQMTESSADGAGKAMAFHMLQKLGPDAKSAVPALTKALDHEDSYVRIQAAYTLWKIDQQAKTIPLLSKALKDTEIKIEERAMAASSLGEIGPSAKAALPALREATKDQEALIRVNAAWALWTVDQQSELAKPVLIDALKNDDLNVFSSAAWALGEIGFDEPGLTALGKAIRDDPTRNSKASAASRALPGLANALNSKYIIPEERDELKKELNKGIPPLPKDPKVQIRLKENGTQADVSLLKAQKPASGPSFGLNMKFSNGKWWIVK